MSTEKRALALVNQLASEEPVNTMTDVMGRAQLDPGKPEDVETAMDMRDGLKDYAKRLKEKAKMLREEAALAERILDSLDDGIKGVAWESRELCGLTRKFQLRNTKSKLEIVDESKIPEHYRKTVTTTVIDTDALRQDLELGVPVEGVRYEKNFALHVVMNRGRKDVA